METKDCPLLKIAVSKEIEGAAACTEKKCAWWDAESKQCAVLTMAGAYDEE